MRDIKELIKLANKFEKRGYASWNPLNWGKTDPHEKVLKDLTKEEIIELAGEAGLQNVKDSAFDYDELGTQNYEFKNSKGVDCWFAFYADFSGGVMGRVLIPGKSDPLYQQGDHPEAGILMNMPSFARNANGKYLAYYLRAVKNSSEKFKPLKVPARRSN
jgi:hypothetical protein